MNEEKKLIKKITKIIASFLIIISMFFFIVTSFISIVILKESEENIINSGGLISNIGAIGISSDLVKTFNEVTSIFNIPNWVLAAVAKQESNFNISAQSADGAYGIMQLQRYDISSGNDLFAYHMNNGLADEYKKAGYSFSSVSDMWNIYLSDGKAQIMAGAFIIRHYTNYVLYKLGKVPTLDYNNATNLSKINWNSDENDSEFKTILRRIFACYNGGPAYGMYVDLDNAQNNYPNKVYMYAMEFRNVGLISTENDIVEKAIESGLKWVGKSPYVWGGGRTEDDVLNGRFDCSSFVHYMYSSAGVQLGDRGSVVTFSLINMGRKVSADEMKRGDLIFFDTYTTNGHVALYLGNGQFLHDAETNGVAINSLTQSYWSATFNGEVRRIVE